MPHENPWEKGFRKAAVKSALGGGGGVLRAVTVVVSTIYGNLILVGGANITVGMF